MKKFLFFILYFLISANAASAQSFNIWRNTGESRRGGQTCNYLNQGCNACDALIVVQNITTLLFELAIPIAVAAIVWGAIVFMTAAGSEERAKKGREIITSAVIGLAIALTAWIIVNIILHILTGSVNLPWNQVRC